MDKTRTVTKQIPMARDSIFHGKFVKYFLILILATHAPFLSARADQKTKATEAEEMRNGCVEDGNQMQLNFCASADFHDADLEMNNLYTTQMTRLTDPEKSRLRDSQRAWLVFRDKACLYEARARDESGSIWPLEHFACLTAHTKQRVEDLKGYVACTQNGCPD